MEAAIVPIGPILLALVWAFRAAGGSSTAAGASVRLSRGTAVDAWIIFAMVLRGLAALAATAAVAGLMSEAPTYLGSGIALIVVSVLLFPGAIVDRVLAPLGLVRLTFWYSRMLCPFRTISDPLAGAVIDASRALRRSRVDRSATAAALGFERLTWRGPIASGWALIAWAELADACGDTPRARQIFEAAARAGDWRWAAARRHARLWMAADAAERGDWERVIALGRAAPWRHQARLMAHVVEATLGRPRRGRARLVARSIVTPSRRVLLPWILRALAATPPAGVEASPSGDADPLRQALVLHAEAVRAGASVRWSQLAALALAWERVASPATDAMLGRRIAVLGARIDPGVARDALLAEPREDVSRLMGMIAEPLPSGLVEPPLLRSVRHDTCDARLSALESLIGRLQVGGSPLPPPSSPDAWAAWGAVRAAYESLAQLSAPAELAWVLQRGWGHLCNHAAWIANACGEGALAHDIFAWLYAECRRLGVPADMKLLKENARVTG